MLFCHFNEKKVEKTHSKLLKMFFFFITALFFNVIGTRTIECVTNMFENVNYKKPIFQALISLLLLEIETMGSSVLYSPWASDHLYTHGNNWITVSISNTR